MKKYKQFKNGFKQGIFKPKFPHKYKGSHPICFRSSWELKFMKYVDNNPAVIKWGSESVIIPYKDPTRSNEVHRYFIDFNMIIQKKDGTLETFLVEVKPYKETLPPKITPRKQQKTILREKITYTRNVAKWIATKQYCKRKNIKFIILTEKNLFPKNLKK